MKTKYSACSGEASPWISHESAQVLEDTMNLCSHNFLQIRNRRLIKKAGMRSCSVRYLRCCRRDCLTTCTIVASMSWYVHICSHTAYIEVQSWCLSSQLWVQGTLVLYSWSYILASMFGVRSPGGDTLNNNITSFMINKQEQRNLAWCSAPRVSLKVPGELTCPPILLMTSLLFSVDVSSEVIFR